MKNKILSITLLITFIGIFIFLVSKVGYSYKEGKLYSQNDLPEYNEIKVENSNLVNRNKAIEIATYTLNNVLHVDTDDNNSAMYVNIYKENDEKGTYTWNVWWSEDNSMGNYGVMINSHTGEISRIFVNDVFPEENNQTATQTSGQVFSTITEEKIKNIIKPLANYLKIKLDDYNMTVKSMSEYNVMGIKVPYRYCVFENDKNKKFSITIDVKADKIVEYKKIS